MYRHLGARLLSNVFRPLTAATFPAAVAAEAYNQIDQARTELAQ
jgi:hypothetical protein